MNPTLKVAKRFPKVKFEHATGFKRSKNVATYNARFYEGRYIIGQIAAKMSKSGGIGGRETTDRAHDHHALNAQVQYARTFRDQFANGRKQ